MTKKDFSDKMSEICGLTKADSMKAYDAFIQTAEEYLLQGERVTLMGFGTLSVQEKPARTARNPRTGETVKVKAKRVVKFKPGKQLSETIDAKKKK